MFKRNFALILSILLVISYVSFHVLVTRRKTIENRPTFTFDEEIITLKVSDSMDRLLEGVHAYDEEDGDVTEKVMVESVSSFDEKNRRNVNYIVFDSDDHISTASRYIQYEDYSAPTFNLVNQLRADTYSSSRLLENLTAYSCVDGDISSKINILEVSSKDENNLFLKLSVSDSTGTDSFLKVHYFLDVKREIRIDLKNYLIYTKVGESFNYRKNIVKVVENNWEDKDLIDEIDIQVPNMEEAGTYEVHYTIKRSNGNTGIATMVVVVE